MATTALLPMPTEKSPADERADGDADSDGQDPHAGAQGGATLEELEVLRDEEDEPREGEEDDHDRAAGGGEPQVAEQGDVEHRMWAASASVAFLAFALVAILLYVTPLARRQPLVLVTSASWLVSTVLVLVGNVRVVDALVRAGMGDTPTSQLVEDDSIESAHDLANLAPWLGVLTALAFTGVLWRYRHVSGRVAIGATVLSVAFPPWIFPGAGVLVLTIARCIAYQRASPTDRASSTGTAVPADP